MKYIKKHRNILLRVMDVFINQPENTGKLVGVLFLYISSLAADITAFTIIIMNHRNLKRYILCLLGLIFGHFLITVFLAYDFYIKDNIALAMLVAINNIYDFFTMGASYICALLISKLLLLNWDKKKNKKLIDKGVIIKNLEYTLVPDKINPSLKRIKVNYVSKNGIDYDLLSKQLISYEPSDKTVDLLIDQDDVSNYYIDFEIV